MPNRKAMRTGNPPVACGRAIAATLLLAIILVPTATPAFADAAGVTAYRSGQGEELVTVWSALLTAGETVETGPNGYCRAADDGFCIKRPHHGRLDPHGSLTEGSFVIDGTTHVVQSLRYGAANPDGKLHLTVDPPFTPGDRAELVLQIGTGSFPLASAFADVWKIGGNYTWVGFAEPWEVGDPVRVSLTRPVEGYAGHTPATANTDLRLGVSKLSRLAPADDRDWYRVDLQSSVSYHFYVRGPRPSTAHFDRYQLALDTGGAFDPGAPGPRQDAGTLRIALYDHEGEAVWSDGAPVSGDRGKGWYRAAFYFRPTSGGAYYLEVASPTDRPPPWYVVGYLEREPGDRP